MLSIHNREIRRALIVDDEQDARDAYEYVIEDMNLHPHKITDQLYDLPSFISSIQTTDVVLCDYHLKKHSYAPCDGDQLVSECFRAGRPGVLCSSIAEPPIRRDYLRYIPGLVRTGDPNPDELHRAWERCLLELDGRFEPARRPWRTLVRVADVDRDHQCFYAVVPAWSVRTKIRIDNDNLPTDIQELLEPDRRFHALVNTGAESHRDLFFDDWESK